jgi:hypothetical protein
VGGWEGGRKGWREGGQEGGREGGRETGARDTADTLEGPVQVDIWPQKFWSKARADLSCVALNQNCAHSV